MFSLRNEEEAFFIMKVLKFGGSSVGTPESILNVKNIVEATARPAVVIVSALGGVTDQLIAASRMAAAGDSAYSESVDSLMERHHKMVNAVVEPRHRPQLLENLDHLLTDLRSILHGVFLIQDLTPKTADAIVAYGERLSSLITAALLDNACHVDSLDVVCTRVQNGKTLVDFDLTNRRIVEHFGKHPGLFVCGGFIAKDAETGRITNLGRGGSDYTAAIIAAALNAEALEIWTDVDGFMTADPRVIPTAYTIPQLSYNEAMELCNFGAKVVYPPTIYPVCTKNIPIYVKNTFHPSHAGSVISSDMSLTANGESTFTAPICGISSVNRMSVVTVSGPTMVGVIGVNRRIFACLAQNGISVFMVVQTSSETSTSLCITPEDGQKACKVLDAEFAVEIEDGAMNKAQLEEGLATVAVVGENMKRTPGIAGKLFSVLGRNGISVSAIGQGSFEMNISFVIQQEMLSKALNVLHNSFFLSEYQDVNVFVCGTGNVGGSLLQQIAAQRERLMKERRLRINLVGVSGRSQSVYHPEGIDAAHYKEAMQNGEPGGINHMVERIVEMNSFNSVFVDCTASENVARQYETLLSHNVSIVAANKAAASSDFDRYKLLKDTARERGVKYLFETNVGAGLPIINTINDLTGSGDKVLRIEAVVSGTLNFVFNALSADIPLSKAVRMAQEQGYSEPDPRVDLSGKDVIRKLTILARESGYRVNMEDIEAHLFIPNSLFEGSLEEFWEKLPGLDAEFEARRQRLEAEGKCLRFVATWADGKGEVGLREIDQTHPFYHLEGSNNIISLTTSRYHDYPMLIKGYGAGAEVTAAGVFADIMRCANF